MIKFPTHWPAADTRLAARARISPAISYQPPIKFSYRIPGLTFCLFFEELKLTDATGPGQAEVTDCRAAHSPARISHNPGNRQTETSRRCGNKLIARTGLVEYIGSSFHTLLGSNSRAVLFKSGPCRGFVESVHNAHNKRAGVLYV